MAAPAKALRPACRLAVAVAVEGERADPRVAAPAELRPILGFTRLSAAAYAVIARVIDDDGIFRARVAEAADEHEVGRAGWLWLHRPVGWADEVAALSGDASGQPADGARARPPKDPADKHRRAAAAAEAARKRAVDQAAEARRNEAQARAERDAVAARNEVLHEERNAAMRRAKALEAELATARRDLKLAREATREAEHELLALRSATPSVPSTTPVPAAAEPAGTEAPTDDVRPDPSWDRSAVSRAVADAAAAAEALSRSLTEAASALGTATSVSGHGLDDEPTAEHATAAAAAASPPRPRTRDRRAARAHPDLPPGIFDGTPEAHRHLISVAANLLVVDGYNLARAAWSGLDPEEERRRTVALLEEVQARSGGVIVVVFDGEDAVSAPMASRSVRVRFSATGQTADDAIADLLAATSPARPVVVVSSDRAVAADARRHGAVPIGSRPFLRAAGR